jgi:beta-glucosidase
VAPDATLAVRDVLAAAKAGVDNFQLGSLLSASAGVSGGGGGAETAALSAAVQAGTLSTARIDDAARRILIAMIRVGLIGRPRTALRAVVSTPAHRALATVISAQATVLLQNRRGVLSLTSRTGSVAVIGYDAGAGTQIEENGSPAVWSGGPVITPVAGIRARAGRTVRVSYAPGTLGVVQLPVLPASALTPSSGSGHGLSGTFYAASDFSGAPIATHMESTLDFASKRAPLQTIPAPAPPPRAGRVR